MKLEQELKRKVIIKGSSVTKEQATDIILRTDKCFYGDVSLRQIDSYMEELIPLIELLPFSLENKKEWEKEWGLVNGISIFRNDWVCTTENKGNGWCSPDGTLFYNQEVSGNVIQIEKELTILAAAFPFLELSCIIYENCSEIYSFCETIYMENGTIRKEVSHPQKDEALNVKKITFQIDEKQRHFLTLSEVKTWIKKRSNCN